ncbi:MAG: DUF4179 domain-containing protein [Dysosmobacter welbionis]
MERALRRRKRDRRLRLFGVPAGSLAACFAAFVLLVNLFPPFARACGSVPVLRELAQAVAWSPSLSAAVENDYVQPIGQSQTVNGVTATVEYVIVDRKQLNIFYTLDYAPDLGPMWADCRITPGDGSAGDAGGRTEKPGELVEIKRDFVDRDVPGILDLTLSVYPAEQDGGGPPAENTGDGYFDQPVDDQPAYLAEMTFHLEFDPYFTAQGTLLELNRTFALDGQTFTLQEAEIYPTHLRLTLTADPDNTAWLAGLDLYLENEHGERFEKSLGGITASGDPEGEGMGTFWLDSPFFSRGTPDPPHHRRPVVGQGRAAGEAESGGGHRRKPAGGHLVPGRRAPAGGMDRVPGVPADGEPDHGERVLQRGLGRGRELL